MVELRREGGGGELAWKLGRGMLSERGGGGRGVDTSHDNCLICFMCINLSTSYIMPVCVCVFTLCLCCAREAKSKQNQNKVNTSNKELKS